MPFYRFAVDLALPVADVAARMRSVTRAPRGFGETLQSAFRDTDPSARPFIGLVHEESFRVQRDIRYRNSLPLVWGRTVASPTGSQLRVTMFLHPLVAIFMAFWLSAVGYGAWSFLIAPDGSNSFGPLVTIGMFVFGIALTLGGFIPEAVKAKQLLLGVVESVAPDNAFEQTRQG